MFFTPLNSAITREDRRPLYRRIFTNRRLDILHKSLIINFNVKNKFFLVSVRTLIGFALFSTSFCVANACIYYVYFKPLRKEEIENLEKELIEADLAGFHIK